MQDKPSDKLFKLGLAVLALLVMYLAVGGKSPLEGEAMKHPEDTVASDKRSFATDMTARPDVAALKAREFDEADAKALVGPNE